ncbi:hypothetical protein JVW19_26225, partial [Vibrio cholerae O1]|nr:hypothetical protein [Vibrio cholerae O1]
LRHRHAPSHLACLWLLTGRTLVTQYCAGSAGQNHHKLVSYRPTCFKNNQQISKIKNDFHF